MLEFIPGQTLKQYISETAAAQKSIPEEKIRIIIYQIAAAISHLHSMDICHGYIKTSNIMYNPNDDSLEFIKLIDFGLSKIARSKPLSNNLKPQVL